jgi:hypothetical protein
MFTGRDYLVEAERRKNEAAEAAQHRLCRQVQEQDGATRVGQQRLLTRLGRLFTAWRAQLQTDYTVNSRPSPSAG